MAAAGCSAPAPALPSDAITDSREPNLPLWAQRHIDRLRFHIRQLETDLATAKGEPPPGSTGLVFVETRDGSIALPDHAEVGFKLDGSEIRIWRDGDQLALICPASGGLRPAAVSRSSQNTLGLRLVGKS